MMRWSLLGLFLMGVGFPKMWATERKWPDASTRKVHDPERSWSHNVKDDFTDDVEADSEWWLKFMGFMLLAQAIVIALLVVLA